MFAWFGWFEALGVILGGFSLFSLVQKLFGFGLASILKDLINFYRAVFYPIADAITSALQGTFALLSIQFPHIPQDIVVTYVLIGAALCRYSVSDFTRAARHLERGETDRRGGTIRTSDRPSSFRNKMIVGLYSLVWPIAILLGLKSERIICTFRVRRQRYGKKLVTPRPDEFINVQLKFRDWAEELGKVIVAFVILFIANAYFTFEQNENKSATTGPAIVLSK